MTVSNLLFLSLLSAAIGLSNATSTPRPSCKAYPDQPGWPSASEWTSLNKTLGGKLMQVPPPGAACHVANGPTEQCANLAKAWTTYDFHVANPVSVMWDQYANWTCLPDPKLPCSPAGYPAFVVNATTPEQVKAGVDFARKFKVRLNVQSTGHDYMGRSNAAGSLSLWTHHMNDIKYNPGEYRLGGSGTIFKGNTVTVGAGAMMWDIYQATDKHNETVVGGGAKSVSVGGYVTGGGHSILANRYGLAADNVIEIQVVTPSGKILVANQDQNRHLFWALRGGGGSTFGVITSVTMKTHPTPKIKWATWMGYTHVSEPFTVDVVGYLGSQAKYMMDSGLSGYGYISTNLTSPVAVPGSDASIAGIFGKLMLQDSNDDQAIEKILKPVNDTLTAKWPGKAFIFVGDVVEYPSFLAWFSENFDTNTAGGSAYLVSSLLDEKSLSDTHALGEALDTASKLTGFVSYFMVAGKGVQEAKPAGGSNAVNPAFRRAYVHAVGAASFEPFNNASRSQAIDSLYTEWEPIRKLSPNPGAYINEAFPFEKNWQQTFWGSNYKRLLQIKRHVDPEDVFWCTPCVGSEGWVTKANGQLCRA